MSRVYQVGIVGCGGMGRSHISTIIDHLPEFQIAALCDPLPAARERVRKDYGLNINYEDCAQMCDSVALDMIVVATQTRGHQQPTIEALRRGISVLCEKPIAINLEEADEMVSAASSSGARLAINQQNHVNPGVRKAQTLVRDGFIGDVIMIRGRNKSGRKSGNEFMEMGTHVTDMMLCFGGPAQWCSGAVYWQGKPASAWDIMEAVEMSPRDRDSGPVMGDRAIGNYGFCDGILGEIHFLGFAKTDGDNYGVDVLGSEGQLAIRASGHVDQNLWHLPRPMEGKPSDFGDWQSIDVSDVSPEAPIVTMYRELMAAGAAGTEPPSSGKEGRAAFEMILGLYQSHREGGLRISLPMVERRHPLEVWRLEV